MEQLESEFDKALHCKEFILGQIKCQPKILIICGSGLSEICNKITVSKEFDYTELPDFPSGYEDTGHKQKLLIGTLAGVEVAVMGGRTHYYEIGDMKKITFPIRCMSLLGCKLMIVSSAVGCVNRDWSVGDIMITADQISFPGMAGIHPMVGRNDARFGPRFTQMVRVYDVELGDLFEKVASQVHPSLTIRRGVLFSLSGPTYETPAEYNLIKILGADVVGMSMAHEVMVAINCGMKVLGFNMITDIGHLSIQEVYADEKTIDPLTIDKQVSEISSKVSHKLGDVILDLIGSLPQSYLE